MTSKIRAWQHFQPQQGSSWPSSHNSKMKTLWLPSVPNSPSVDALECHVTHWFKANKTPVVFGDQFRSIYVKGWPIRPRGSNWAATWLRQSGTRTCPRCHWRISESLFPSKRTWKCTPVSKCPAYLLRSNCDNASFTHPVARRHIRGAYCNLFQPTSSTHALYERTKSVHSLTIVRRSHRHRYGVDWGNWKPAYAVSHHRAANLLLSTL